MARVLITGCSTGFGRAAAVELTKRGHEVLATARRPETLDDLDVTDKLRLDVDDDSSVADAVASTSWPRFVSSTAAARPNPVEQPVMRTRAMASPCRSSKPPLPRPRRPSRGRCARTS